MIFRPCDASSFGHAKREMIENPLIISRSWSLEGTSAADHVSHVFGNFDSVPAIRNWVRYFGGRDFRDVMGVAAMWRRVPRRPNFARNLMSGAMRDQSRREGIITYSAAS